MIVLKAEIPQMNNNNNVVEKVVKENPITFGTKNIIAFDKSLAAELSSLFLFVDRNSKHY
jgi:hypothetical protein